jgi:hypothetical protein
LYRGRIALGGRLSRQDLAERNGNEHGGQLPNDGMERAFHEHWGTVDSFYIKLKLIEVYQP